VRASVGKKRSLAAVKLSSLEASFPKREAAVKLSSLEAAFPKREEDTTTLH